MQAFPALMGRCWTRRGRPGRPLAWATSPPGGETLSPETRHGPLGLELQAMPRAPGHAGLAAPQLQRLRSVLGFVGRLLSPRPFGFRSAVDPRLSSASFPSAMGLLHALLRRTGRWRQSEAVL